MGKIYDTIDESLKNFVERQRVYFVATAPLSHEGHINLSPQGLDSFLILDERTVAFADLVGSGIEEILPVAPMFGNSDRRPSSSMVGMWLVPHLRMVPIAAVCIALEKTVFRASHPSKSSH